ncbi:hypothetical protein [Nocardia sp. NPDC050406]|uniref:hypothetical protein n=1 Tax=Nocardia sp. NPDC050406 TaxID=3364318 RepID=UPI00379F108E
MNGRTVTAALVATLAGMAVSACGSEDSGPNLSPLGPEVTPPSTTGAAAVPDSPTLRSDLLAASQLPAGYTALPDPEPGDGGAAEGVDPKQCAKVLAPIAEQSPNAVSRAVAQFEGTNFTSIDIDAAGYANGAAAQAFSAAQSVLRECTRYTSTASDQTTVEFRLGGLQQPTIGDASTAFTVDTASEGVTLHTAVSLTLVGSTVVQVALTAPEEPDPQQLSAVTAAQVRKLQGIAGP